MPLNIYPMLLNSSSPWASSKEDLQELYDCPFIGAVTVRTCLLRGYQPEASPREYLYFDARTNTEKDERSPNANSSLNRAGYSPIPLAGYLNIIESLTRAEPRNPVSKRQVRPRIDGLVSNIGKLALDDAAKTLSDAEKSKPFIVSVAGSADDIVECYKLISQFITRTSIRVLMEVNLYSSSLPNKLSPAYSGLILQEYLFALQRVTIIAREGTMKVHVGLKIPPYTYSDQFTTLVNALLATTGGGLSVPIAFITATNTLGNCLVLAEDETPPYPSADLKYNSALNTKDDMGLGGVGGTALHALALGNVCTLRTMLDKHETLKSIEIIGTGGVSDYSGYQRMKSVGAAYVAVGTAHGLEGIDVFAKIAQELETLSRLMHR